MNTQKLSVTMAILSGKVAIVIIACVSVIMISSIVIPIAIIFSGGESKTPLTTTTKITTTTEEGKSTTVSPLLIEFLLIQFPNMEQDPRYQLK